MRRCFSHFELISSVSVASAGKTIVAELLLIKSILENKRQVLFIEPFVSIVQEKATYFRVKNEILSGCLKSFLFD